MPRARPAPHCRLSLTASFHSHCSSSIMKVSWRCFNLLEFTGNYSATSNNTKLVHWPLMGGLLHLVQRGRDWAGPQPAQSLPRCTNVTAHPSTANVPVTVLFYNGPFLCGFNIILPITPSLCCHTTLRKSEVRILANLHHSSAILIQQFCLSVCPSVRL